MLATAGPSRKSKQTPSWFVAGPPPVLRRVVPQPEADPSVCLGRPQAGAHPESVFNGNDPHGFALTYLPLG